MLNLDRRRSRYVVRDSKCEVLERGEIVPDQALRFVLSNEQNFAQVGSWRGAAGCPARGNANDKADFQLPCFGALNMYAGKQMLSLSSAKFRRTVSIPSIS